MKALCRNLLTVLSVPSGVIGVVAVILLLIGYRPYILMSPSMEPRYPEGSFCIVDTSVSIDELNENDVIIYADETALVMHRLISFNPPYAVLQGDANNNSQTIKLDEKSYVGRLRWSVPRLGRVVDRLISGPWLWIVVGVLVVMACLPAKTVPTPPSTVAQDNNEQINTVTPTQEEKNL